MQGWLEVVKPCKFQRWRNKVVSTLIWRCSTVCRPVNLATTLKKLWNVCRVAVPSTRGYLQFHNWKYLSGAILRLRNRWIIALGMVSFHLRTSRLCINVSTQLIVKTIQRLQTIQNFTVLASKTLAILQKIYFNKIP